MVATQTPKTSTGSTNEAEGGVRPHPERIARKYIFIFKGTEALFLENEFELF